jgi:hypothetical protein
VSYDQSTGSYVVIGIGIVDKSFTTTSQQSISSGSFYKFKVEARNAVGYSEYSQEFEILSAIIPGAPSTPITYNDGTNVFIRWDPPSTNPIVDYGDAIRGYKVWIRHNDGINYSKDLLNCDGENDQNVINSASCVIPLSTLQGPPFNLEYGAAVLVKVIAFNSVGDGPQSAVGGNAVSATVPNAPVNLARSDLLTSVSQISLTWEDGDFDGGSPVIDY